MPDSAPASAIPPVPLALYDSDFDAFSARLGAAFERYGFAVLGDHGVDPALLKRVDVATKAFFALPETVKTSYHRKGQGGARGYTPFGVETAKGYTAHDLKEFYHVGRDLPAGHPYRDHMADNIWPEVQDFHEATYELYTALDNLGKKVLRAIAVYLGLDREFFTPLVKDGNSVLRLLHYPPVNTPGESVRAGAHGDINVITLLLGAEEPGLQLLDRDGQWLPITPPANCIVCNIGDMLSRLTNGVLPSTVHRVVNPAEGRKDFSRYSTPFFLHFESPYVIRTLPNCMSEDRPDQFPEPITAHEFLQQRIREIKLA
ncbi:isopenicillin N synthase family dioxygenase [Asticcacaulis biprosthecium]|uniref:isopenicillin N synthase family dioxygenase n=1 Tax=Asticcacaulis biprosthecium TaxID=76891 RepID=UPI0003017D5A|nr:2-oxoglutarate and iron-dependent oxygenase domain-containing protein [Asticcacaulis biprosthecium]